MPYTCMALPETYGMVLSQEAGQIITHYLACGVHQVCEHLANSRFPAIYGAPSDVLV